MGSVQQLSEKNGKKIRKKIRNGIENKTKKTM